MKTTILILMVALLTGCVQTRTLSQLSPEAMTQGLACFEAIHGSVDDIPDPEVYFARAANSDCVDGPQDTSTMACAGSDRIDLVIGRWDRYRQGRITLVHEYLHVLYHQHTDVPPDFHHDDWKIEFNRPECYNIPYRKLGEYHQ